MDAVAFMVWKRIVPWKVLSLLERPGKPVVPIGYGTNSAKLEQLAAGSRIWVVTRIAKEFSLAARMTVRKIVKSADIPEEGRSKGIGRLLKQWDYVAIARLGDSKFFETNNAKPALAKLGIQQFSEGRAIEYRRRSLDRIFARCMKQAEKTLFISYKWSPARRFALDLAQRLRQEGLSPWIDARSIPGYLIDREPGVTAPRLKQLLRMGIDGSRWAVIINTPCFATEGWTKEELRQIRARRIPCFQVMRKGKLKRKCEEPPIDSMDVEVDEVVKEIRRRCRRRPTKKTARR